MVELTFLQKRVLEELTKSPLKEKFYWSGGTALSVFYLHHRQSNDLDFFSDTSFTYDQVIGFIRNLKQTLKLDEIEEKKIYDRWEFFLHNKGKLRLEFVFYNHPKLKTRKNQQGLLIDSLDDIAANKLMAFFDRNDPKDLFDLYYLITKAGYSLKKLIKLTEKKFGVKLQEISVFSEASKSIDNLNELKPLLLTTNPKKQKKIIEAIRNYFKEKSNQELKRIL